MVSGGPGREGRSDRTRLVTVAIAGLVVLGIVSYVRVAIGSTGSRPTTLAAAWSALAQSMRPVTSDASARADAQAIRNFEMTVGQINFPSTEVGQAHDVIAAAAILSEDFAATTYTGAIPATATWTRWVTSRR